MEYSSEIINGVVCQICKEKERVRVVFAKEGIDLADYKTLVPAGCNVVKTNLLSTHEGIFGQKHYYVMIEHILDQKETDSQTNNGEQDAPEQATT